jgi:hypothetical protein
VRLEKAGYLVDTAADGVDGLDKAMGHGLRSDRPSTLPSRYAMDLMFAMIRQAGIATLILMRVQLKVRVKCHASEAGS